MPYPVKVQPIDVDELPRRKFEPAAKPVMLKARFKRLFERRNSVSEKPLQREGSDEFEPSSICLARMVQNYIEENNDKPLQKCGRNRCNCFNGADSSDDDSSADACFLLKSLVPYSSVSERNLLADISKIVERNKTSKSKDLICREVVTDGLVSLGYDACICKSQWGSSSLFPAGMYEYVDVITEGERLIIDMDFRSEFEIARSSKAYNRILQAVPNIFVGKADRLEKIIAIVCEAAKVSLKKKGMPCPPWRKAGYVKAKWLSPYTRINPGATVGQEKKPAKVNDGDGEFDLLFGDENSENRDSLSRKSNTNSSPSEKSGVDARAPLVKEWEPPEIRPKSLIKGVKVVTGLASVIQDD